MAIHTLYIILSNPVEYGNLKKFLFVEQKVDYISKRYHYTLQGNPSQYGFQLTRVPIFDEFLSSTPYFSNIYFVSPPLLYSRHWMAITSIANRNIWDCLRISQRLPRQIQISRRQQIQRANRNMSTIASSNSVPHELRTASEPRQDSLHLVRLSKVTQVNPTIRLLRLSVNPDQSSGNDTEVRK
jgi:hypothetical protein